MKGYHQSEYQEFFQHRFNHPKPSNVITTSNLDQLGAIVTNKSIIVSIVGDGVPQGTLLGPRFFSRRDNYFP